MTVLYLSIAMQLLNKWMVARYWPFDVINLCHIVLWLLWHPLMTTNSASYRNKLFVWKLCYVFLHIKSKKTFSKLENERHLWMAVAPLSLSYLQDPHLAARIITNFLLADRLCGVTRFSWKREFWRFTRKLFDI